MVKNVTGIAVILSLMVLGLSYTRAANAATVFPVCKRTVAMFTGNLGGIAGADAKCLAEYSDTRFARDPLFVKLTWDRGALFGSGWMSSNGRSIAFVPFPAGLPYTPNDCVGWTSNAGTDGGAASVDYRIVQTSDAAGWYKSNPDVSVSFSACSSSAPIWCCNF
jgi:hypothetical protein